MTHSSSAYPGSATRLRALALRLLGLLVAVLAGAGAALAQSAAETDAIDPPGRVGSVTLLAGPVTMVDLATGSREEALLNWPVTGGWRIETAAGGRAEVRIGSTILRLAEQTTVDFPRVDDEVVQIAVLRGAMSLRLRSGEVLDEIEVLTQRERLVFDAVGRYRIDVDRRDGLTAVTAFSGSVRIGIGRSTFVVGNGQRGELAASPMIRFEITTAAADRFDEWVAARDAREDTVRSAAYVSRETTGVELLDAYGDWRPVDEYGPVWFPRGVPASWAPYRYGRWIWVSPWGWTWVDEAPWGFAPLHYGRWVVVGGLWGWIPGVIVPRPVYAPALVAWFGAPGFSVSIGAPVGWFPLGPREVYVPPYRYTPRYLRVVNRQHVPNVAEVTIVQTPRYVNRHPDRSTWVPGDRFGRPEPVHRGTRPPPSEWRQYIARPQPPANVPNTKRRQGAEDRSRPAPSPVAPPPAAAPAEARPLERRATPVPRAVPAPSPTELPRAVEVQPAPARPSRTLPATPATVRPEPSRPVSEPPPAAGRDERRRAPRAPLPSAQQPSAPHSPAAERTPPRQPAPAAMPPTPRSTAPAAPATIAPPAVAAPPRAAPAKPATAPERDAGSPPSPHPTPSTRPDSGDPRGSDRGRIGREAAR